MRVHLRPAILYDMNHPSSETRLLADSIAGLVATITQIINAKVQAANATGSRQANPAAASEVPGMPGNEPVASETFIGFQELCRRIPLCERTLWDYVRRGRIPSIRLPGALRILFHWASVQAALLRLERGGTRS